MMAAHRSYLSNLADQRSKRPVVPAAAARDKAMADFAEDVVQVLIEMKAPGCRWLPLTEIAA